VAVLAPLPVALAPVSAEPQEATPAAPDNRIVLRAVPSETKVESSADGVAGENEPPPDGPPRGGGKRPVLKRVK